MTAFQLPRLAVRPESRAESLQSLKDFPPSGEASFQVSSNVIRAVSAVTSGQRDEATYAQILNSRVRAIGSFEKPDEISEFKITMTNAIVELKKRHKLRQEVKQLLSREVPAFLENAKALETIGRVDSAIDLVNDSVDEMFRQGKFDLCDAILAEVDVDEYSTDVLLSVLTATIPARNRLYARKAFFKNVKRVIEERKEYERGLLDGLE